MDRSEQLKRLVEARTPKPKKERKPIAKISEKRKKQIIADKELLGRDAEFYKEVYAASPHFCQNCNISLPKTPSNFMFHHLLEKRNYPQFRHEPLNIAILCLECHSKCETNIDFAPRIKKLRAEVENILLNLNN